MAQKGIHDPIQLEQELLKNFQTNPAPTNQNKILPDNLTASVQEGRRNFEEIKYASV